MRALPVNNSALVAQALMRLHGFVARLKIQSRHGWNSGNRRVDGAESVADHSYGLAVLAMGLAVVAERLRFDHLKLICICLIHDLVESITTDINVHIIKCPIEKARVKADKKARELAAIGQIREELGETLGEYIYALWMEYEEGRTIEAAVAHQLDAIEALMQAVYYQQAGHRVDPWEFYDTVVPKVTIPELLVLMQKIAETIPPR